MILNKSSQMLPDLISSKLLQKDMNMFLKIQKVKQLENKK